MPPRDLWDLNPVFQLDFWFAYADLLERIGFREDEQGQMVLGEEEEEGGVEEEEIDLTADEEID